MKNKKVSRYLLLAGLIIVLVAVGYINYLISSNADNTQTAQESPSDIEGALQADDLAVMAGIDDFTAFKTDRESTRETEVAYLDSIIDNENSDVETVKDAQEQKMAIVAAMEAELKIEGLLVASGFSDAIVTVKEGSVNVVIEANQITKEEAAKVLEIVQQETDEPAQNIKIILPQGAETAVEKTPEKTAESTPQNTAENTSENAAEITPES